MAAVAKLFIITAT